MKAITRVSARAFFQNIVPDKKNVKCCRYDQNGQPLEEKQVDQIYSKLGDLIQGWKLNEGRTRLIRHYYIEDYQNAISFIQELGSLDSRTTRNCPSFSVQRGEIMTLELYSPSINGLSNVDFELAMNINRINIRDFYLININDLSNYRNEVTAHRMKVQSEKIQTELNKGGII